MTRKYINMIKICRIIHFCPYGGELVRTYPENRDETDPGRCAVFNKDCPAFYLSEPFADLGEGEEELDNMKWRKIVEEFMQF